MTGEAERETGGLPPHPPPPMVVDLLKTEDCTEDETGSGQVFIGHCTNCGKFCEKKRFVIL